MSERLGVDSATGPTVHQASLAGASGIRWWAGYVGGSQAAAVWSPAEWHALKAAHIAPLPIWVPDQSFSRDPVQQSRMAMAACRRAGLTGVVALDTEHAASGDPGLHRFVDLWNRTLARAGWKSVIYDGASYHGAAFSWHPLWDGNPTVSPRGAKQYAGNTTRWGLSVDLDSAGPRFPVAPAGRARPERVVVSPAELESLADLLRDSEYRVVSVKRQVVSMGDSIRAEPGGAFGTATEEIRQALTILDEVTGPTGLHHLVGALYDDETFVRRAREQALRADRPSAKPVHTAAITRVPGLR